MRDDALSDAVDGSIRRLGYNFNPQGLPYQQTSYSDSAGTNTANQIQDLYNGLGQLVEQDQSAQGPVISSTPAVKYNSTLMAGGENNSRLRSIVYPNGRILDYTDSPNQQPVTSLSSSGTTATMNTAAALNVSVGDKVVVEGAGDPYDGTFTVATVGTNTFTYTLGSSYNGSSSGTDITAAKLSLDTTISRVDGEQDHAGSAAGTVLEGYSYLGLSTIVQRARGNGVGLSYINQTGAPTPLAPGGDQYTGLDAFGRVVDQIWGLAASPTDRFQYDYDRNNNVLFKNNIVTPSNSELYHANSTSSGDNNSAYDNLNRLQAFERGVLSSSTHNGSSLDTISSPTTSQNWSLDLLGNWSSDSGVANGNDTRTFNAQNQITGYSGTTSGTPSYDNNGNMLSDGALGGFVYDAWNRLVNFKQSGVTLETRAYYADRSLGASVDTCQDVTTRSYYSADWQVLEEDTQTGSGFPRPPFVLARQFVWGQGYVDDLVLRDDSGLGGSLGATGSGLGRRIYALQDANYNVTALTDTSGAVLERFVYDPYGAGTADSLGYGWEYLFQGGRRDLISGLYNFRNRDYNAGLGVWMQKDPTGAAYVDGMNLYQADDGNPSTIVDPSGLWPLELKFGAFIPKHLGINPIGNPLPQFNWAEEPLEGTIEFLHHGLSSKNKKWWYFSTDNRDYAGQDGTSRLYTKIDLDTCWIGHLETINGLYAAPKSDDSHRILVNSSGAYIPGTLHTANSDPLPGRFDVKDLSDHESTIHISAKGFYPFMERSSSSIVYDVTWDLRDDSGVLEIRVTGMHTRFPAFEGLANGGVVYQYYPAWSGPNPFDLGTFGQPWVGENVDSGWVIIS